MKAKLLKLLALADDPRTPKAEADSARAMAEQLARTRGIDLNRLKDEQPTELKVRYGRRRMRFAGRLAASLAGKVFSVRIDFDQSYFGASSKLVFRNASMETLTLASKLFFEAESEIVNAYAAMKSAWKFMYVGGYSKRLCKRSFMTGFFNGLRESVEAQAKKADLKRQRRALPPKPLEPPRPPEPPNPYALAVIEKPKPKPEVQTQAVQTLDNPHTETTTQTAPTPKQERKLDHESYGLGYGAGKITTLKYAKHRQ